MDNLTQNNIQKNKHTSKTKLVVYYSLNHHLRSPKLENLIEEVERKKKTSANTLATQSFDDCKSHPMLTMRSNRISARETLGAHAYYTP